MADFIAKIKDYFENATLQSVFPAILTTVIAIIVVIILKKVFKKVVGKSKLDKSFHGFLNAIFSAVLYFLVILIVAKSFGVDTAPLIALLSVASLALSLSVQGLLTNIISGMVIMSTHPIQSGEYVEINGAEGTVKQLGLIHTTLETVDGKRVYVPNSEVSSSKVTNFTREGKRRVDVVVTASYDCDPEQVKRALYEACMVDNVLTEEGIFVKISAYKPSDIEYTLRVWTKAEFYWDVYFQMIQNVHGAYEKHNVKFTYPHLEVNVNTQK